MPAPVALVLAHRRDDGGEPIPQVHRVVYNICDDAAARGWQQPRIGRPACEIEIDELSVRPKAFARAGEHSPAGEPIVADDFLFSR